MKNNIVFFSLSLLLSFLSKGSHRLPSARLRFAVSLSPLFTAPSSSIVKERLIIIVFF